MEHQILDFRQAIAVIGRRWPVLVAVLLLGLAAGAVVLVVSPATYRAQAQVLLPPPANASTQASGLDSANTEALIIGGADVLSAAGKSLRPAMTATTLAKRINVRAITDQVEEVTADASSAVEAARLANAVANAYVVYSNDVGTATASLATSVLEKTSAGLKGDIQNLVSQIAAGTALLKTLPAAQAQAESSVIDSEQAQEATLEQEFAAIENSIAQAQLAADLGRQGTRVLQPATPTGGPIRPRPLWDVGGGALAGLVVGVVLTLALEQGDRRLRFRDEIAIVAGAPILASIRVPAAAKAQDYRMLLEHWEPSVVDSLALHRAFAGLGLAERMRANLVVVALAEDPVAPALSLLLACFAASRVTRSALVIGSHHACNAPLREACLAGAGLGSPLRDGLVVYGAAGDDSDNLESFDLSITSLVAEPGPLVIPTWDRSTVTVLAVSSGGVTGDRLGAVVAACAEAGMPLQGVFLANPQASDQTTGRRGLPAEVSTRRKQASSVLAPVKVPANGDRVEPDMVGEAPPPKKENALGRDCDAATPAGNLDGEAVTTDRPNDGGSQAPPATGQRLPLKPKSTRRTRRGEKRP